MLCWFEGGLTDSFGALDPLEGGLALIKGIACPHYDGEVGRREAFRKLVASDGRMGWAADNSAALHFVGGRFKEAVASVRGKRAYRLKVVRSRVVETPLPVRNLRGR
jgi:hypothetical protein